MALSYHYEESNTTAISTPTKLSYLAVDPHIEEIYVGEPIRYRYRPGCKSTRTAISDTANRWLKARAIGDLQFVTWITDITFGNEIPKPRGTVLVSSPLPDGRFIINGPVSDVTCNWLAYSKTAINIYSGKIELNNLEKDLDDSELQRIAVPKSVFPERPDTLIGISSISFNAEAV